jgi:hypothetical protein
MANHNTIINEIIKIPDTDQHSIHAKCLEWLNSKNAKIIENNPPNRIIAYHGKDIEHEIGIVPHSIPNFWNKTINITIGNSKSEVILKISITKPANKNGIKIRQRWWASLVEELANHLNIDLETSTLRKLYPISDLYDKTMDIFKNIILILVLMLGLSYLAYSVNLPILIIFIILFYTRPFYNNIILYFDTKSLIQNLYK